MQGLPGALPAAIPARLGGALGPNGPRAHYMRARVEPGRRRLALHPLPRQDSSLLSVLAEANALSAPPPGRPVRAIGDAVEFIWLSLNL